MNEMKDKRREQRAGFTLVEVMLVVVIIAILASVAAVATKGKSKKASIAATRATIKAVSTALDAFEVDNGVYPNSLSEIMTDTGRPTWDGPYLKGEPNDAWGVPLTYSVSETGFKLVSAGPDGQTGTGDDITN